LSDGQPQATTAPTIVSVAPVTQISDGQIQASTVTAAPVSQISDGQVQAATTIMTMGMISMISDGQIQAPTTHAGMTVVPVSQISDGQIQATATASTVVPVSQISDGQIQATTASSSVVPVSQISDGQIQASSTATAVSQISDGQIQASSVASSMSASSTSSSSMYQLVACASNDTLSITLADGILHDAEGRTGYIASNYQFQFDKPAQAGAIYTAGWSVCSNGSLALGGSAVFYQCLSGGFYNLYDRSWAAQCSPVTISTLMLEQCS